MPEMSPTQAESYKTPRREKQGGLRSDPSPDTKIQHMDQDTLRALQRHHDLNVWLEYQRRLTAAYARSQDPHPRRWLRQDSSR